MIKKKVLISSVLFFILSIFFIYFKWNDTRSMTLSRADQIMEVLDQYYQVEQLYPNVIDELVTLGWVEAETLFDEWGYRFYYMASVDKDEFSLISLGKDGKLDTNDDIVFMDCGCR